MMWLAVIDCLPPDSYIVLSVLSMSCFFVLSHSVHLRIAVWFEIFGVAVKSV